MRKGSDAFLRYSVGDRTYMLGLRGKDVHTRLKAVFGGVNRVSWSERIKFVRNGIFDRIERCTESCRDYDRRLRF